MKKKTIEGLLDDYKERVGLMGEDYVSITILSLIANEYSKQYNYEQAVRYSKMAYESCMRLYGPNDLKTSLQLDELIEYYESLGDDESIELLLKEYHRIKRESSLYELPNDEDEGIPFP